MDKFWPSLEHEHHCPDGSPPPAHQHGPNTPLQSYPLRGGCQPCHPHDHYADDFCDKKPPEMPECPPPKPCPLPPPIPPVRYVPGMDVQEQLTSMANHVNTAIDRWNQIQHNCYEALNRTVGAAVSNDVYYERCEVRYFEGYSSADAAKYEIIEACPTDAQGHPIVMRLMTAYNARQGNVRQPMSDASFVTSANAIITARMTAWSGLCLVGGNPQPTTEAVENAWYAAFNDCGQLLIVPQELATVEECCRRRIQDLIGPVIPIVEHGKVTSIAANFADDSPAAIQAIGWKKCNGHKIMFSTGFQDNPGCTVNNVANLLVEMGVTTAVITCRQTAYGSPDIQGFENPDAEKVTARENFNNGVSQLAATGDEALGLTGGMMYIGNLADRTLDYQMPSNSAFWVITKRPPQGWRNRFTGEIADICQKLGNNSNQLDSIQGKLDIEQAQILDLKTRVGKLEENDKKQDETLLDHAGRISKLETDMEEAQDNIHQLMEDLSQETQDRIAADADLQKAIDAERTERVDKDNALTTDINNLRTTLIENITKLTEADQNLTTALQNEVNARIAADTNLQTLISLNDTKLSGAIAAEEAARKAEDAVLLNLIKNLEVEFDKINIQPGPGLQRVINSAGMQTWSVKVGAGVRLDSLDRVSVDTDGGIALVGGKVTLKYDPNCFNLNDKGELTMNCCGNDNINAGTGLSYTVDSTTGETALNLDPPKNGEIGGVKAGAGVTIAADGTISANGGGSGGDYTLPAATATTLGGVIVGENLTVEANGKINAPAPYELPVATADTIGGVRVGQNLTIDQNGVLNAQIPDNPPSGNGDTVLAGTGIDIVKDGEQNTATISLDTSTQGTLAQVGDIKTAQDSLNAEVNSLKSTSVTKTELQASQAAQDSKISQAVSDAASAQTQAAQANAAVEEVNTKAETANTTATAAQTTASDAKTMAQTAVNNSSNALTTAQSAQSAVDALEAKVDDLPTSSTVVKAGYGVSVTKATGTSGDEEFTVSVDTPVTTNLAQAVANSEMALRLAGDALPKSGGTMTGTLAMGEQEITGNGTMAMTLNGGSLNVINTAGNRPDLALFTMSDNTGFSLSPSVSGRVSTRPVRVTGIANPSKDYDAVNLLTLNSLITVQKMKISVNSTNFSNIVVDNRSIIIYINTPVMDDNTKLYDTTTIAFPGNIQLTTKVNLTGSTVKTVGRLLNTPNFVGNATGTLVNVSDNSFVGYYAINDTYIQLLHVVDIPANTSIAFF